NDPPVKPALANGPWKVLAPRPESPLFIAPYLATPNNLMSYWFLLTGLLNVILCLLSLLPTQTAGGPTDGRILLHWLRNTPQAQRELLWLGLQADLINGVRPRDWDKVAVERLLEKRQGIADDVGANLYGYYHALDTGDPDKAGAFLDLATEQREAYPAPYR